MRRKLHSPISKLLKQIAEKRQNAKRHGLEIMSEDEFLKLALASPHWRNIGPKKHQFVFCRKDHLKGYTAENTFIGSVQSNIRERLQRCGLPRGGKDLSTATDEEKRERRRAQSRASHHRRSDREWNYKFPISNELQNQKRKAAAAPTAAASNSTIEGPGGPSDVE